MIAGLGANEILEDWVQGVYFLPNILKTAIVAIHQLPVNEDTLWLRVLGKGGTQKRAVEELTELPENNPFRENLLEILADWRKNLELRDNLSKEQEEVIMNLSPAYLQQIEDWKQEGKQEGKLEAELYFITSLLEGRFGSLDAELSGVVAKIAKFPISERTQLLLSLGNLSREELLQRLSSKES
jgi:flagellar biosynthesis/type III secretory pathway protein FliH